MAQDVSLFLSIAEIAGVFVGFGALIFSLFEAAFVLARLVYWQAS